MKGEERISAGILSHTTKPSTEYDENWLYWYHQLAGAGQDSYTSWTDGVGWIVKISQPPSSKQQLMADIVRQVCVSLFLFSFVLD